ncbi:hypothetical protein HID58_034184, partial [Brassica napus]
KQKLYHYDTSVAMGSIKGEWHLGIFGRSQEIEEIRVMMVAQRIWNLPRYGVEIGNLVNHLSDLGGMSTINSQTIFFCYHLMDWNINIRDCFGKVLEIGIWLGSVEEILEIMEILFQIFVKMVTRGFGIVRERQEPREEGEIGVIERGPRNLHKVEKPQLALPEPNGAKLAISGASATGMDVEGELGDSTEIENLVNGLEQAMDLVGNGNAVGDNVAMTLDGSVAIEGRKEELSEGVDDFQALTDEETIKTDEDMRGIAEGEEELGGNGDQDAQVGEEEKKKGARKVLFKKPPGIAMGTSKLRLVQAVLSPRKNGASKSSKRQGGGEGLKQAEEKGPLNPKNSAKPVYAALGYYFFWNKLNVCYAFCIYSRIREIRIERNFVVQWSEFRNKEKRDRLELYRIIGSLLMHNGVGGNQVWSLVSLNHGQTIRSLYGRSFGNLGRE